MKKKFYLTTAIPYVNSKPHIGHALEYVIADAIHRYYEISGFDVKIISGADENALKNLQAAQKVGIPIKKFLDQNSKIFKDFYKLLEVNLDVFRRTTDKRYHRPGVQKFWKLVEKSGDIYKKNYKGLYCVGCEEFVTKKDLKNGKCIYHNKKPEFVEEENYFFKLKKYQDRIRKLISSDEYEIIPKKRKKEVLSFIKRGLKDISISRTNERAKTIGIPVPSDNSQKIYVWFDALNVYQTAVGFGHEQSSWKKWWPADLHIVGKDIIRFHAVYWPAMLLSAKLPLPKKLLVHGFVTSGGKKMSKTLGNVVDPYEVINKYGVEPFRYFLLSQIPTLDDGDFTWEKFEKIYKSDLADGLGNLVSRIAGLTKNFPFKASKNKKRKISPDVRKHIENYQLDRALENIWRKIKQADTFINERGVWNLNPSQKKAALQNLVERIRQIAFDLKPFLPKTSEKIEKQFAGPEIKISKPLFPYVSKK